jgi:aspartate oxidase
MVVGTILKIDTVSIYSKTSKMKRQKRTMDEARLTKVKCFSRSSDMMGEVSKLVTRAAARGREAKGSGKREPS